MGDRIMQPNPQYLILNLIVADMPNQINLLALNLRLYRFVLYFLMHHFTSVSSIHYLYYGAEAVISVIWVRFWELIIKNKNKYAINWQKK